MSEIAIGRDITLFPITIIDDRYSGFYSNAKWLAFNLYPGSIPWEVSGDDIACMTFWDKYDDLKNLTQEDFIKRIIIGKGSAPNEAHEDLIKRMKESHA